MEIKAIIKLILSAIVFISFISYIFFRLEDKEEQQIAILIELIAVFILLIIR